MPNPNHPPLAPQPPRIGRPSRRNARVAGILAAILGMIAVSSQAQDRAADRLPLRALPTLSFPSVTAQGTGDQTDVLRQFRGTALQDLKNSGVFRLLNPARAAVPTGLPDARPSPAAGAELMLRFVSHSLAKGKLLIQGECVNVATGAIVLKKSFMGQTEAVDRMAHRMVDFLVGKVTGVPGAADSTLVFAKTTAHGIMEIFGMDRDGRNPRQLTAFGSLTLHPAVAGDGRLAFVTYKGGPPQIWGQVQPKGPYQLLYPKDGQAGFELSGLAWSPDGRRLAFVQGNRQGRSDIQLLDPRSGRVVQLTPPGGTSWCPSWDPEGTALAYLANQDGASQVFLMASDGSPIRRLTGDPEPKVCVTWNAKGDRIAYSSRDGGQSGLFILAPDGTGRQKLLSSPEPVGSLCWAPDGRALLLAAKVGDPGRPRIVGLDGKIQDLAEGAGGCQSPQWFQNPVPEPAFAPHPTSPGGS